MKGDIPCNSQHGCYKGCQCYSLNIHVGVTVEHTNANQCSHRKRESNACSTPASRPSAVKQWLEQQLVAQVLDATRLGVDHRWKLPQLYENVMTSVTKF